MVGLPRYISMIIYGLEKHGVLMYFAFNLIQLNWLQLYPATDRDVPFQ